MSRDEELRELLSALLDGELDAAEEREVRALLERSPAAREELEGLSRVRLLVRDLDDVEPPAGFLEALAPKAPEVPEASVAPARPLVPRGPSERRSGGFDRAGRKARTGRARHWPRVAVGAVAAAAAIVLVLGLTPLTDEVVPPVNAYAERHLAMMDPAAPPSATKSGFTAVPASELDQSGAPAHLAAGYDRMGGYHTADGVMHLMYEKDDHVVSVYLQHGRVSWSGLPANGTMATVDAEPAWEMDSPHEDVMIVERGSMIYTVVAVDSHDGMMDVLRAMPEPPAPSMMERVRTACRSIVQRVGLGD